MSFFQKQNEIVVLDRFDEIQEFIGFATDKLEWILKEEAIDKSKFPLNSDLKPMQIDVQKVVDMISNFKFEHYKNQNLIQSSTPQKSPEVYEKKENEENNKLVLASDVNKIKSDREEGMNSTQNSLTKHNRVHTLAEDSKASTTPFQKLDTMKRRNESSNIEINNKVDENQYKTKFEKIKVLPVNQNRYNI